MCDQEAHADVCIYVYVNVCTCMWYVCVQCMCVYDLKVHANELCTRMCVCMYVCKYVPWKKMLMCACAFTCVSYSVCMSLTHSSEPVGGWMYVCVHAGTWLTSGEECVPV